MKNKAFFILFIVNIVLAIVDFITTMLYPYKEMLESNPVFRLTGSFIPIILINVVIYYFCWKWYKQPKTKDWMKFFMIEQLVVIVGVRIYAIRNAVTLLLTPHTQTDVVKFLASNPGIVQQTTQTIALTEVAILVCGILSFLIWKWDNYGTKLNV